MEAYILRRDLLKEGYDYNTVLAMDKEQLAHEMNRQLDIEEDPFIAIYDFIDLEELISLDAGAFNPSNYYLRIFQD